MRLLIAQNVVSTQGAVSAEELLEEFSEWDDPKYAILSHTWGQEEVVFRDFNRQADHLRKAGWAKIRHCAEKALQSGLQYIWVDTCCIDKSSSSELSESLNSMFRWYANSTACYAYLEDLHARRGDADLEERLGVCRWFTRGWTLQELLAPRVVRFYNAHWEAVGTKHSLIRVLGAITGIPDICLMVPQKVQFQPVAERMSWAAGRKTTRLEDRAYCLLGIFSVNMPLLYGEGERSLTRLQEEILKESEDQTMLAWGLGMGVNSEIPGGLLATSPALFASCGRGRLTPSFPKWFTPLHIKTHVDAPWEMTSRGLHVDLSVSRHQETPDLRYALLHCTVNEDGQHGNSDNGPYALLMPLVADGKGRYSRPRLLPPSLVSFECLNNNMREELESMSLYWAKMDLSWHESRPETDKFDLCFDDLVSAGFELRECYPPAIVSYRRGYSGSIGTVKCYRLGSVLFRFTHCDGEIILLRLKPPSFTETNVEPLFHDEQGSSREGIWDLCYGTPQHRSRFPGSSPCSKLAVRGHLYSVEVKEPESGLVLWDAHKPADLNEPSIAAPVAVVRRVSMSPS